MSDGVLPVQNPGAGRLVPPSTGPWTGPARSHRPDPRARRPRPRRAPDPRTSPRTCARLAPTSCPSAVDPRVTRETSGRRPLSVPRGGAPGAVPSFHAAFVCPPGMQCTGDGHVHVRRPAPHRLARPLAEASAYSAGNLCRRHAELLKPPRHWELRDVRPRARGHDAGRSPAPSRYATPAAPPPAPAPTLRFERPAARPAATRPAAAAASHPSRPLLGKPVDLDPRPPRRARCSHARSATPADGPRSHGDRANIPVMTTTSSGWTQPRRPRWWPGRGDAP